MKKLVLILCALLTAVLFTACGKKAEPSVKFEIQNGKIVQVGPEGEALQSPEDVIFTGMDSRQESVLPFESDAEPDTGGAAGEFLPEGIEITDGVAVSEGEAYNSLSDDQSSTITALEAKLTTACAACRSAYVAADKGETYNVTLSSNDIAAMAAAIADAGYAVQDSNAQLNMYGYQALDSFGRSIAACNDDISAVYFIIYPDGHLSAFMLSRELGRWHLYSMSAAWNDDGTERIYSKGRYAVGEVRYTEKGWLIYSRDTSDFDENQKANTDTFVMIRVLPMDSEAKTLCQRYVEPVGYFENNLFTTNWTEADFSPVDFNSLYAYIFAMYNGTDMLSAYNSMTYYESIQGTKLYLVPQDIFENNVGVYFRIDNSALKNISDYSSALGGYFFLGYDRDYYNVTPRTPFPEVVDYSYNSNGTITMTVDAVNKWYGTDQAFRHEFTVRPGNGAAFQFVSNRLIESEDNILPAQKLSEMLNVERTKTSY